MVPFAPTAINCAPAHTTRLMSDEVPVFWSVQAVTVNGVEPEIAPEVAVIVVEPVEIELAIPFEPGSLLMVAIALSDELQITDEVTSPRKLLENVPNAMNCLVIPIAMIVDAKGFGCVATMDTSTAGVTVIVAMPDTSPMVAVMFDDPRDKADAQPRSEHML